MIKRTIVRRPQRSWQKKLPTIITWRLGRSRRTNLRVLSLSQNEGNNNDSNVN